ncbi:MAG: LptA/OstA family protein [Thermoanaerobaculum sp.]
MKTYTRLYRGVTAGLLAAWLGFLVGILVYRQWQRRAIVAEAPSRPTPSDQAEQPVRVQKGFVFTYALGVSPSIRVAARESVEYASGWLELSDVDMTFFEKGEVAYGLLAAKARFHQRTNQAVAEGDPTLSLGHGIVARARAFALEASQQQLRSQGRVSFAGPGWGGLAGRLVSFLGDDLVTLSGGVSLVAQEHEATATLLAAEARYRRKEGVVEFPERVAVFRGGLRFAAPSGRVFLEGESGGIEKLSLAGPVIVDGQTEAGEAVDGVWGACEARRQADGTWAFSAEAAPSGWAQFSVSKPGGEARELFAWRFEGVAFAEGLVRFEGLGLACAQRSRPRELPSALSAERLVVSFVGGQPAELLAEGAVRVQEAAGQAEGDKLSAKLPDGPGELVAKPGNEVRFASGDVQGSCGHITFDEMGGFAASGGVRGSMGGDGQEGGLRFAAARASGAVSDRNRVTLAGDARVWQRDRLLRADTMVLDGTTNSLRAVGNVFSKGGSEGTSMGTIEAAELTYDRTKGEALFSGGVRVSDARGLVTADSLLAYLSEKGEILRGEFRGQVVVQEKAAGRTLRGDTAVYRGANETLEVWGQPAVAEETSGNRIRASRITWNRASQTMEVGGDVDRPSETLYHPQQPVKVPARRTPSPRKSPTAR